MFSGFLVAAAAGAGVGIWVYRKFARRASGREFNKTVAPAIIAGVLTFLVMITMFASFL